MMKLSKRGWWETKRRKPRRVKRKTKKERKRIKMVHLDHRPGIKTNDTFSSSILISIMYVLQIADSCLAGRYHWLSSPT
jgi:hypothetical protein